ncbi:hypothetical protein N9N67_03010 [Bacteriovoracaceae bacterium]|nr:hypothetical protein [Bacteriovoracaceae bacterium]
MVKNLLFLISLFFINNSYADIQLICFVDETSLKKHIKNIDKVTDVTEGIQMIYSLGQSFAEGYRPNENAPIISEKLTIDEQQSIQGIHSFVVEGLGRKPSFEEVESTTTIHDEDTQKEIEVQYYQNWEIQMLSNDKTMPEFKLTTELALSEVYNKHLVLGQKLHAYCTFRKY